MPPERSQIDGQSVTPRHSTPFNNRLIMSNIKPFFYTTYCSKNVCWRLRQFGTSAKLSVHFEKCLGSEVSWVRSVSTPRQVVWQITASGYIWLNWRRPHRPHTNGIPAVNHAPAPCSWKCLTYIMLEEIKPFVPRSDLPKHLREFTVDGKTTESVHCTITDPCLCMHHSPSAHPRYQ